MVAVVDYGVGNLFSLVSSFRAVGAEVCVTRSPTVLREASHLLLPGVGAFEDARRKLAESGMEEALLREVERGKPLLGICLGMQLLFDESLEFGTHRGLSLVPGRVVGMQGTIPEDLLIPHIGWNALNFHRQSPLFLGIEEGAHVYFVHSYYAAECEQSLVATTEYGSRLTAAVERGNVFGCQFHPEKSGEVGLSILRAFVEMEG